MDEVDDRDVLDLDAKEDFDENEEMMDQYQVEKKKMIEMKRRRELEKVEKAKKQAEAQAALSKKKKTQRNLFGLQDDQLETTKTPKTHPHPHPHPNPPLSISNQETQHPGKPPIQDFSKHLKPRINPATHRHATDDTSHGSHTHRQSTAAAGVSRVDDLIEGGYSTHLISDISAKIDSYRAADPGKLANESDSKIIIKTDNKSNKDNNKVNKADKSQNVSNKRQKDRQSSNDINNMNDKIANHVNIRINNDEFSDDDDNTDILHKRDKRKDKVDANQHKKAKVVDDHKNLNEEPHKSSIKNKIKENNDKNTKSPLIPVKDLFRNIQDLGLQDQDINRKSKKIVKKTRGFEIDNSTETSPTKKGPVKIANKMTDSPRKLFTYKDTISAFDSSKHIEDNDVGKKSMKKQKKTEKKQTIVN